MKGKSVNFNQAGTQLRQNDLLRQPRRFTISGMLIVVRVLIDGVHL
jgi:hypothetical protein